MPQVFVKDGVIMSQTESPDKRSKTKYSDNEKRSRRDRSRSGSVTRRNDNYKNRVIRNNDRSLSKEKMSPSPQKRRER